MGVRSVERRRFIAGVAAVAIGLGAGRALAQAPGTPVVAAASDLNAALPEVARMFTKQTGASVNLTFGSSGTFAQQIQNGAPFQVFLSADERYVQQLVRAGKTDGDGTLYAIGRIGLFLPRGSRIQPDSSLSGLATALRNGVVQKFAIANPEHAPYGRAAREALQSLGLWSLIQPKLVMGENVSQATQFATAGSAQGGIIPLSLALTPQVKAAGTFTLIPTDRHTPLRQKAVLIRGAGQTARAFYDFLHTAGAQAVFKRYGFLLPS